QPKAVGLAQATVCTASVDGSAPTGTVTFSAIGGTFGDGGVCQLTASEVTESWCSTTYARSDPAETPITATYAGDGANDPSTGTTTLSVTQLQVIGTTSDRRNATGQL